MSYKSLLNKYCDIQESTATQSELGEVTYDWTVKKANVKTRVSRVSRETVIDGEYRVTVEDFKFYFTRDTAVTRNNRLEIEGETYEIIAIVSDSSDHHKVAYARIIKP